MNPPIDDLDLDLDDLDLDALGDDFDVDAVLADFEARERDRLGLDTDGQRAREQWREVEAPDPSKASRHHTTILLSGLTMAHDYLVGGALNGLGYKVVNLDCPDHESLRFGKEFGNRGQCNPTYFTVGNLVKYLSTLRDGGMTSEEIIDKYVFLTAGSCGPCRFGMYVTEYRKALRDAGFEGFRVMLFSMQGGLKQASGDEAEGASDGLVFAPAFFVSILKAIVAGDCINALGYRIRPYEVEEGATDRALEAAKQVVYDALNGGGSALVALLRARRILARIKVDKTRVRPRVGIIGEFWAMTTEGDGSYKMPAFLQSEGAEVDVQLVTSWITFLVWEHIRDTKHRLRLRQDDEGRKGLAGKDPYKKIYGAWIGDKVLRATFQTFANALGLHGYHLVDMDEMAAISRDFYNNDLRGGEGHLEVGKVIMNVVKAKVNMTLSIKPFGCMPSSGVSDGIQSAVTELYPEAIFLPIETTGDGAVNVYSRVQMMLFKARQAAQREVDGVLDAYGMTRDEVRAILDRFPILEHPMLKPPHRHAAAAADMVELVGTLRHPVRGLKRAWRHRNKKAGYRLAGHKARGSATA